MGRRKSDAPLCVTMMATNAPPCNLSPGSPARNFIKGNANRAGGLSEKGATVIRHLYGPVGARVFAPLIKIFIIASSGVMCMCVYM